MTYRDSAAPGGPEEGGATQVFPAELEPELMGAEGGALAGTSEVAPEFGLSDEAVSAEREGVGARPWGSVFQAWTAAGKAFVADHAFAILYAALTAIAYGYLLVIIGIFFLQKQLPRLYPDIIDSFSDPYLGILGIYVLVVEMKRRQKEEPRRLAHETFVILWITLLAVSSVLTLFSQSYHFNSIYRMIITNSLAATIIRVGAWLHF